MSTNVQDKLVVRVVNQLSLQALSNLSTECSLVLHVSILTKSLLEEFLIDLMLLEALDFCNLVAELRLQVLDSITLNLQKLRNLCIVVWISLLRVESDDIAYLSVIEEVFLLLYLDITWHHNSTLNGDTTFLGVTILIEFTQITLQHIVSLIRLCLLIASSTRCIHINLLVKNLIIYSNVVVINLVTARKCNLEFWCYCDIKHKCVRTILLNVNWSLLL